MPLADDLLTPAASADPYPLLAELREHAPVHWSEAHRAWLVTRYQDNGTAFADRALSNDRVRPLIKARVASGQRPDRVHEMMADWMVVSEPPEHTRLRRLAASAFKGQRIAAMTEQVEAVVDRLLDRFLSGRPDRPRDLISELAYPLPATVIATMLGAPLADRDRFREWSDELALVAFGTGGEARAERHERALRGLKEMEDYFRELVVVRRAEPSGDMLSAMMARDPDNPGDRLSDDELIAMCALLLFAGHETTMNSIANGMLALLRHPEQLARFAEQPDLTGTAVEELLRYDGPIKVLNRWVMAETELAGKTIRPGERVHLVLAGANRDPARFADADRLDLTRTPNPHIAFGKGIHACLGAQLARLETRIALRRIVDRVPGLRLAGEPLWKPSLASRSLQTLPVAIPSPP
jgi:cytochrome P450